MASEYALNKGGGNYGAFFGVIHVDGDARKANFYFKDIDGKIADKFSVLSKVHIGKNAGAHYALKPRHAELFFVGSSKRKSDHKIFVILP